ncbi:hypothetical protein UXU46_04090 [Campylobacter jejuni]
MWQGAATKNFILFKNPAALEKLALVKYAFFDKTGTLTKEKLSVFKHNLSKDDFDKLCQIESLSSHPIAKALLEASNIKDHFLKGSE